ncbi:MAG: penicillin-binding transpeptidase domain-containing protein [Chloroflexota bacterium]|nr:penicillin-binding transpeptidase domain-containing protein [Chloroflexota bacterium]
MLLAACQPARAPIGQPTPAEGNLADAAAAQSVAERFFGLWEAEDTTGMYGLLSTLSQDAISQADFQSIHQDLANTLTLQSVDLQALSTLAGGDYAQVAFRVTYHTLLVGDLTREPVMNLTRENRDWRIQWGPGLLLPELADGSTLEFVQQVPDRGRIFARDGAPLAAYEDAIALGLVPGEILPEQASQIYETLAEVSEYSAEGLAEVVDRTPDDWYLPVATLSQEEAAPYLEALRGLNGVRIDSFRSRYYVDGGVAPHALGYMLYIPEDELDDYLRKGYRQDERVGAAGLEAIYEAELSGQRGGSLYLVGPDGKVSGLLASSDTEPGQTLVTTLDKTLQAKLQASLGDLRAAVVVMEVDTGRVLALVSNPGFDPNAFDLGAADSGLLESYFTDEDQPLFNRATQGQYPLGSIFKLISMSTALETGIYSEYSSFNCQQTYWTCDSVYLDDWTLSHGASASGVLSLPEGLMRSCNPWFYRIGETLYTEGYENDLVDMARSFDLGKETGIELPEAAGNIPETAETCVMNAQLAIGQGEILVTPLQVASFIAALANGGTLYRPSLMERIEPTSGEPTLSFEPESQGKLPISEETRQTVLDAMRLVVADSRGTGYWPMLGLDVPISGKTGTAQTPSGNSHAWFAGFTRQNDPERPDIAVVVLVENGGEGSEMAAPVFRRAVSLYFSDYQDNGGTMPWEDAPYVPHQPTPTPSPTPDSTSGE